MLQDPTNQYIAAILSQCDLTGKEVVEIGCGKGRITRDLAQHATRVYASDPDPLALDIARAAVTADNVAFLQAPAGVPQLPEASCDVVIYTLSLHHVPAAAMSDSLRSAATLLRADGVILIVEPGEGGSLTEAKERFGAGSGDERPAREAAIRAMHALEGWVVGETICFRTLFRFDDEEDFFVNLLADYRTMPDSFVAEVRTFLRTHRTHGSQITLEADRRLNVLRPSQR